MVDRAKIEDWFWRFGRMRAGSYAVSLPWFDGVVRQLDHLDNIEGSLHQKKGTIGLWGPSQSGKSTLLSRYIDHGVDCSTGRGGALDWGAPTVFSRSDEMPETVVALNPRNFGADASGCVTRFTMLSEADLPPDPRFPIRIEKLNRREIFHALALGFAYECDGGDQEFWCDKTLEESLARHGASTANQSGPQNADSAREGFGVLHDMLAVADALIRCNVPRFRRLNAGHAWDSVLRNHILFSSEIWASGERAMEFAAHFLWAGSTAITELCIGLLNIAQAPIFQREEVYCSIEVASVLLNAGTCSLLAGAKGKDGAAVRTRTTVEGLSWDVCGKKGTAAVIGVGLPNDLADSEFGCFQGIVRELIVPLREPAVRQGDAAFQHLVENYDLLDFPGVARADAHTQHSALKLSALEARDPDAKTRLYTDLLKRGKTACLVHEYADHLGIDAFVLLTKAKDYPAKPGQLVTGMERWWSAFDPRFSLSTGNDSSAPLPLWINLTFFASVISEAAENQSSPAGSLGEMLRKLEPLTSRRLSRIVATTYPHFHDGEITLSEASASTVVTRLGRDTGLRDLIGQDGVESIGAMVANQDGGVGNLLQQLVFGIDKVRRRTLVEARRRELSSTLLEMLSAHSPETSGLQIVQQAAASFTQWVKSELENTAESAEDPDGKISALSLQLRCLTGVDPESLQPLPNRKGGVDPAKYVAKQVLSCWVDSKARFLQEHPALDGTVPGSCGRLLRYVAENTNRAPIDEWLSDQLEFQPSKADCSELRRALAFRIAKEFPWSRQRAVALPLDLKSCMENSAKEDRRDYKKSPHYTAVIKPILDAFSPEALTSVHGRPDQVGDAEILRIIADVRSFVAEC